MELKRVKNVSGVDQTLVVNGKAMLLRKDQEIDMEAGVATAFLSKLEGLVVELADIGGVVEDESEKLVLWIANMTGDPDARDEVDGRTVEKGRWLPCKRPNPVKQPRTLTETSKGDMQEFIGQSGVEARNLFPTVWSIPPFKRRKFPLHTGKWFMNRVATGCPGAAIKSRAPSAFEPDMRWDLDDMRMYLGLVAPGVPLGKSLLKLKTDHSKRRGGSETELKQAIRREKEQLMKRLHKYLANPAIRLPRIEEFEEYKAAQGKPTEPDPEDITPPPAAGTGEAHAAA